MKILFSSTNTNPYTNRPAPTRELGESIKAGWSTTTTEQKNVMWFNVMYRIGKDFNTSDGDQIVAKLRQNRADVVEQLTMFVPAPDAGLFVDQNAAAAWAQVMG